MGGRQNAFRSRLAFPPSSGIFENKGTTLSAFLVVDQDENLRLDICNFFQSIGHSVYEASDYAGAAAHVEKRGHDVIIASVAMAGGNIGDLVGPPAPATRRRSSSCTRTWQRPARDSRPSRKAPSACCKSPSASPSCTSRSSGRLQGSRL